MDKDSIKDMAVLYEPGHVEQLLAYCREHTVPITSLRIVALEHETESALEEHSIEYTPLLAYVPIGVDFGPHITLAHKIARLFHEHPAMQFFTHGGIHVGEVLQPMLDEYFQQLARYVHLLNSICAAGHTKKLIVPFSGRIVSAIQAPLSAFEARVVVEAAFVVAAKWHMDVETFGNEQTISTRTIFLPNRFFVRFGIALYNLLIRVLVRRKPLRLYASEYWSHIEPFMRIMGDAELIMQDRKEIRRMSWKDLIRHRTRFTNPMYSVGWRDRREALLLGASFTTAWSALQALLMADIDLMPDGTDWRSGVMRAFDYVVTGYAPRIVADIDSIRKTLQSERPDKVLLRASIGGAQHHFFLTARISRMLGIPSIEVQHAGAVMDRDSVHSRLEASYLAAYGSLTRDMLVKNQGVGLDRVRPVGSPRFDRYISEYGLLEGKRAGILASLGLTPERPVVLAMMPGFGYASPILFSSYELIEYFDALAKVLEEVPGLQMIFKFRMGNLSPFYEKYVRGRFAPERVAITDSQNVLSFVVASDVVLCGNSTTIYEAMLGQRPLALFPWKKFDTAPREIYGQVAPIILSADDLVLNVRALLDPQSRAIALERQNEFLKKNYSFDGHSAERTANMLHEKLHAQLPQ